MTACPHLASLRSPSSPAPRARARAPHRSPVFHSSMDRACSLAALSRLPADANAVLPFSALAEVTHLNEVIAGIQLTHDPRVAVAAAVVVFGDQAGLAVG